MKLREIYTICKNNYEAISWIVNIEKDVLLNDFQMNEIDEAEERIFIIKISEARNSSYELLKIKCLEETANKLLALIPGDYSITNRSTTYYKSVKDAAEKLKENVKNIIELCESINLKKEPIAIDIKIPEINNISEFRKIIDDLEFVFTKCPFLQSEARLKFDSFDVGSAWITLALVGASVATISIALNNLAAFIDKCIIVKSHYLYTKKQEKEIEALGYEKEKEKVLLDGLIELNKISVKKAISDLEKETNYKIRDEEERSRTELTIDKMGKLIEQGLQIYSSIETTKETQALFEPLKMKYISIADEINLLTDKKAKDDEKEE